jgi:hypothetical protein
MMWHKSMYYGFCIACISYFATVAGKESVYGSYNTQLTQVFYWQWPYYICLYTHTAKYIPHNQWSAFSNYNYSTPLFANLCQRTMQHCILMPLSFRSSDLSSQDSQQPCHSPIPQDFKYLLEKLRRAIDTAAGQSTCCHACFVQFLPCHVLSLTLASEPHLHQWPVHSHLWPQSPHGSSMLANLLSCHVFIILADILTPWLMSQHSSCSSLSVIKGTL